MPMRQLIGAGIPKEAVAGDMAPISCLLRPLEPSWSFRSSSSSRWMANHFRRDRFRRSLKAGRWRLFQRVVRVKMVIINSFGVLP